MTHLSPLERAVVEALASENWPDFKVEGLIVKNRNNTGAGRYTYLEDQYHQTLSDGTYGTDTKTIKLKGVPYGATFLADVSNGTIYYLEIAVIGNDGWDGNEDGWELVEE
jgi:hypothetical protein